MSFKIDRRRGAIAVLSALIAAVAMVAIAQAATSGARAVKPSYDGNTLRLSGAGGFRVVGRSATVNVTVCLQRRSGGSFIDVRCSDLKTDTDHSVATSVAVPGCVKGAWRTTAAGYATNKLGAAKLPAYSVSGIFHC